MKIAYLIKKKQLYSDSAVTGLLERLSESGMQVYDILQGLAPDTDMLLSFGGDGTFLSAANLVCREGIPILGVNLGRLGFLSEYDVTQVHEALSEGKYGIVERSLLEARVDGEMPSGFSPYALNEVVVRRQGTGTLGIEASIDSEPLPTYWADGMLVSTGQYGLFVERGWPDMQSGAGCVHIGPDSSAQSQSSSAAAFEGRTDKYLRARQKRCRFGSVFG